MKPQSTENLLIDGPDGAIELLVECPPDPKGIALVTHPHPLFGGANTNKVAHTLARTLRDLGYVALRPNFRGVGRSVGAHDHGNAETEDMLAVLDWAHARWPELQATVLAGFSFGAFVQTRVAQRLAAAGKPARRLVLVGTASGYVEGARSYVTEAVSPDTLVIHGSKDETVPLANVLAWAEPIGVPVLVVPGADHFFHGRLQVLRDIVNRAFCERH
ncbi:MAG: alpha/beta hydrolase [Candidatus Dactylopiibacterium carminicum]|uniref:Alpha/beta hydrolase n=1 Tax=Candidatus Dactylopiibacterium carminicum TaxID=857335 RepID=A0A272EYS3_9RHOO|nr:alpha/beta fold hydrolase [Candidatus Dactylopiibacterium carminicum]KAF7600578.1 alpha/beta hydrolase [Candidatus Dactylopiibacterium carminicum]PAS94217.1 MAG: alpha/beta hydrolase [Candidatus Dactylopiibacterium carminicum]PAS95186.1 MAG: alpha/beta hydrolase [Candidatus Dactylopiibacterium carminicum]PAT00583.1 MAG: alpha/beta hydrolase [Candidatus Dactylopiibacterium carminicum]